MSTISSPELEPTLHSTAVAAPEPPLTRPATRSKPERLASLDALRGFDMFWIVGGGGLILALAKYTGWEWLQWLGGQLEHPLWNGFAFYDLIFPLFLFISGVTMPFSLVRRLEAGDAHGKLYLRILRRVTLLVFLGMVVNGFLRFDWPNTRYPSVLGRIGLAYGCAAVIVMQMHGRLTRVPLPIKLFACFVALLLGYWAILVWVPVPGVGRGTMTLTEGGWLGGYIDRHVLPGKLYRVVHDPEGLLATIPAVGTALLGVMTGFWLRIGETEASRNTEVPGPGTSRLAGRESAGRGLGKAIVMAVVGAAFLKLGKLWDPTFPINKNMWTSSFVLYAGGWSLIFLSLFYFVIDVLKLRRWAFFFTVIGLNPITIYVARAGLIDFQKTAHYLFDGVLKYASDTSRPVWWSLAVLAIEWLFLYFLYRKKVFLRV